MLSSFPYPFTLPGVPLTFGIKKPKVTTTPVAIIGAGPQGLTVAKELINNGLAPGDIVMIDRSPKPLYGWTRAHENIGAPTNGNEGLEALRSFYASTNPGSQYPTTSQEVGSFIDQLKRLFSHHPLQQLAGVVTHIRQHGEGFEVQLRKHQAIRAKAVILATGSGQGLSIPDWVRPLKQQAHHRFRHLLEPGFITPHQTAKAHDITIVGGGLSSISLAIRLIGEGKKVRILRRDPLNDRPQNQSTGIINPEFLPGGYQGVDRLSPYQATSSPLQRRAIVEAQRPQGVLSRNYINTLHTLQNQGKLELVIGDVVGAQLQDDKIDLHLADGQHLETDQVLLSTGYTPRAVPTGPLLERVKQRLHLPTHPDGYPALSPECEWRPGLFVMGGSAEHVAGPNAINLAGGQIAAERIAGSHTIAQLIKQLMGNR
jgi:thioredoxin reductase